MVVILHIISMNYIHPDSSTVCFESTVASHSRLVCFLIRRRRLSMHTVGRTGRRMKVDYFEVPDYWERFA